LHQAYSSKIARDPSKIGFGYLNTAVANEPLETIDIMNLPLLLDRIIVPEVMNRVRGFDNPLLVQRPGEVPEGISKGFGVCLCPGMTRIELRCLDCIYGLCRELSCKLLPF